MPDFDALSAGASAGTTSGGSPTGGAGASSGGSSSGGVPSNAGSPSGGTPSGGTTAGTAAAGGGTGGVAAGGGGAGGDTQADGGSGLGEAGGGAGGEPSCWSREAGVTMYTGFDDGLQGPGFSGTSSDARVETTMDATGASAWDPQEGSSCPGALRFSFAFKGYASDPTPDEVGYGSYFFAPMNWSNSSALHVKVKVSPVNAPITGVRLFVISGSDYRYVSVFNSSKFKDGEWNEMILLPVAGPFYDPTDVRQLGTEIRLARAGTAGIPAQAPQVQVWLDDIWLEPK